MRMALVLTLTALSAGCSGCEDANPSSPATSEPGTPEPTTAPATRPAAPSSIAPVAEPPAASAASQQDRSNEPAAVTRSSVANMAPVLPGAAASGEVRMINGRLTKMPRFIRLGPAATDSPQPGADATPTDPNGVPAR